VSASRSSGGRCWIALIALFLLAAIALAGVTYRVEQANCTGCGDCDRICPVDAIEITPEGKSLIDPETCIGCGFCQVVCSYDAIR
jgi:ferredoxin